MSAPILAFLTLVLIILHIEAFEFVKPTDLDLQAYCGVEPYPTPLPPIPVLNYSKIRDLQLLDTHIFFRHGDRSVIAKNCFETIQEPRVWETECPHPVTYGMPGLTNRSKTTYPINIAPLEGRQILDGQCHFGQLTQRGVMMAYNNGLRIGNYLNQTYSSLGAKLNLKSFSLRTTDVHRTKQTAISFMTGILDTLSHHHYPTGKISPISEVLGFVDAPADGVQSDTCVGLAAYFNDVYSSPEWLKYEDEVYKPLEAKLRMILNDNNADLYSNYDCLKTAFCHGKPVPPAILELHAEMEAALLNYWSYGFEYNRTLSNQIISGPLVVELLPFFTQSFASRNSILTEPKVHLWSAHDLGSLQNMLSLFQIKMGYKRWPQYQATFQIEFYSFRDPERSTNSYVRFLLNGKVVIPAFCPSTDEFCSSKTVLEYLVKYLPLPEQCPNTPRHTISGMVNTISAIASQNSDPLVQYIKFAAAAFQKRYQNYDENLPSVTDSIDSTNDPAFEFLRWTEISGR